MPRVSGGISSVQYQIVLFRQSFAFHGSIIHVGLGLFECINPPERCNLVDAIEESKHVNLKSCLFHTRHRNGSAPFLPLLTTYQPRHAGLTPSKPVHQKVPANSTSDNENILSICHQPRNSGSTSTEAITSTIIAAAR